MASRAWHTTTGRDQGPCSNQERIGHPAGPQGTGARGDSGPCRVTHHSSRRAWQAVPPHQVPGAGHVLTRHSGLQQRGPEGHMQNGHHRQAPEGMVGPFQTSRQRPKAVRPAGWSEKHPEEGPKDPPGTGRPALTPHGHWEGGAPPPTSWAPTRTDTHAQARPPTQVLVPGGRKPQSLFA